MKNKIKSIILLKNPDRFIINDKYDIDCKTGTIFHIDGRGDFPQYVFVIRDFLLGER